MATTGCKKEEETVKHVSKIYSTSTVSMNGTVLQDLPRHISEEWIWTGDKVTTRKNYYSDGRLMHTANYSYTDGRLTTITDHFENDELDERVDIAYNSDGKISTLTQYNSDTLVGKYIFEYNGSDKFSGYTFIHHFLDIDDTVHYTVEWTGDNITSLTSPNGSVTTFAYDNNPNPYFGITDVEHIISGQSKNNLISYNGDTRVYTYDSDGWPIKYESAHSEDNFEVNATVEFYYKK